MLVAMVESGVAPNENEAVQLLPTAEEGDDLTSDHRIDFSYTAINKTLRIRVYRFKDSKPCYLAEVFYPYSPFR